MISSVILIILQEVGMIDPNVNQGFWKIYIPVVIVEIIIYWAILNKIDSIIDFFKGAENG